MSPRTLVGFSVWPALFLTAFAVSLRLLPVRPLMTVVPPEVGSFDCFLCRRQVINLVGHGTPRDTNVGLKPDGQRQHLASVMK
jgi:hypothetical protein